MTISRRMAKQDTFQKWIEDGEADSMLAVIQSLSMQGHSIAEIGIGIGVSERTLSRLIKTYPSVSAAIKNGRRTVVAMCQNKLMDKIQMGDTTAIIYALKVYGGDFFKDDCTKIRAEVTGRNGQPIEINGPKVYLPMKDSLPDEED